MSASAQRLATAARALTGSGVKLCSEKTLVMPFLAYYGCSKLLKARAVFYWGTHTRFTVSVGIDPSLTKTRRTRSTDSICMDKRARPLWEIVYYSDTCIVYLTVSETEYFTEILRNILRMREQWLCPGPPPPGAWERGRLASYSAPSLVPRPSRAPARKRVWNGFLGIAESACSKNG